MNDALSAETATGLSETRPLRRGWWIAAGVALIALGYLASPLLALMDAGRAAARGDVARVGSYLDIPAIQRGLLRQVLPRARDAAIAAGVPPALAGSAASAVITAWLNETATRERLAPIIAGQARTLDIEGRTIDLGALSMQPWRLDDLGTLVRSLAFTGPNAVRVTPPLERADAAAAGANGLAFDLRFGLSGWQLVNVALPPAAIEALGAQIRGRLSS